MHAGQLVNSAKCTSTAIATSSGSATDAFVSSAGSAAAKTCGGDATAEVLTEVSAMATALAEATVKVTGKCETNGSATGQAVAYGFAKKTCAFLFNTVSQLENHSAMNRLVNSGHMGSCLGILLPSDVDAVGASVTVWGYAGQMHMRQRQRRRSQRRRPVGRVKLLSQRSRPPVRK